MVGLRSGNVYTSAPMDDGPSGNLGMDARSGTSSSTAEMDAAGTLALIDGVAGASTASLLPTLTPSRIERSHETFSDTREPRSSEHRSVDDEPRPSAAAVAEHRSRLHTDVGENSFTVSS